MRVDARLSVTIGEIFTTPTCGFSRTAAYGASSTWLLSARQTDGVRLVDTPLFMDMRGTLTVAEISADIPFEPKRYFVVFDVPSSETRGEHAHRECHQFLVCIRGTVLVVVTTAYQAESLSIRKGDFPHSIDRYFGSGRLLSRIDVIVAEIGFPF